MRGIEVDKGLNSLETGWNDRVEFLRRNMVKSERIGCLYFEVNWSIGEDRGYGISNGSDLSISTID